MLRPARMPIELLSVLYLLMYLPYMLITRKLATTVDPQLGRPPTGLETLPVVMIAGGTLVLLFIGLSGWWRSAHRLRVGRYSLPVPTRWTALSGVGTALLLFTVPLSLTFAGVSIPFMQVLMRGDVLVVAPLVDLLAGRKVSWYSWVALVLVAAALSMTVWERGGLRLPPLALGTVVLYTLGYFVRLMVMTRVAKNGDSESLKGYFTEENLVAMPLSVLALWVLTRTPLAAQGAELHWGFTGAWISSSLPLLGILTLTFAAVSILSALILLSPRENTFCVPLERAASIIAGSIAAYLLAILYGQPLPTGAELLGVFLLIAAIVLLTVGPRLIFPRVPRSGA